jgi:hypothetical protein
MSPIDSALRKQLPRTILIDVAILICIYFIPALSHIAPFPLYLLDPMRIFLLLGYLLTRQNSNAYILAITIPLFSALVSGHPPLFKAILIAVELSVNIILFIQFLKLSKLNVALALFLSIVGSKIIYYALKFVFINHGYVEGDLVTTDFWYQFGTAVSVTVVYKIVWKISSGDKVYK